LVVPVGADADGVDFECSGDEVGLPLPVFDGFPAVEAGSDGVFVWSVGLDADELGRDWSLGVDCWKPAWVQARFQRRR
jgi:hypothetical protein